MEDNVSAGWLAPLLQARNLQDREPRHTRFDGGSAMATQVLVFVDFPTGRPGASGA